MAEVGSTGVSHMCDNSTVSVSVSHWSTQGVASRMYYSNTIYNIIIASYRW